MVAIVPFLHENAGFDPNAIKAMSMALEDVCKALNINGDATAREVIAIRIIGLATQGEYNPTKLRDRILADGKTGTGC